jgi:hypothetical protein
MIRRLFLLLILSISAYAADEVGQYTTYQEASLTSAVQAVTVQQIASGTHDIAFKRATIWCSSAATFTLAINGTAATSTSGTVNKFNLWQPIATATSWTASNVGTGTVLKKYDFQAAQPEITIDLSYIKILRNAGTGANVTLSTNSITSTCRISFVWAEIK